MDSPSAPTPASTRSGVLYHYVAWNEIPGKIDVGTYTGNGADNRNITGVGFQPDFVMVQTGPRPGNRPPVAHSTAMGPSTDTSHFFGALANRVDEIQRLQPDGFQVGTQLEVNGTGDAYFYAAWGRAAPTAVRMASHERPPNGERRRPRVAHRVRSRQPGLPRLPRARKRPRPPHHQPARRVRLAAVVRHRRPAPATRTAGATRRLARVRPTSSTGWKRSR